MKTTKQPPLSSTRAPKVRLLRSRRMPAATLTSGLAPELLLKVLIAFRKGDFTVRMPTNLTGLSGKIADNLNEIIENEARLTKEFIRVAQVVGKEGKMSHRVK